MLKKFHPSYIKLRFRSYQNHLKAKIGFEWNEEICDKNCTYITFKQFKLLYIADSSNWRINEVYQDRYGYDDEVAIVVGYLIESGDPTVLNSKTYRYIKFIKRRDFCKAVKFLNQYYLNGEDWENNQELLELMNVVKERSLEKVKEANAKVKDELDKYTTQFEEIQIHL